MKTFVKQGLMLIVVVVIVALIRHRVPPSLPMPSAHDIHGQTIEIQVQTALADTQKESWQLVQLPNKQYQVLVREKYQIKGKFNATRKLSASANGQTFQAAGTVFFNKSNYAAKTIHVDAGGKTGFITFVPAQASNTGTGGSN